MRYLHRLIRILRDYRHAARGYGVPVASLLLPALRLRVRNGLTPREALMNGLLDPALPVSAHAAGVGKDRLLAVQRRLNAPERECLTEDKALFYLVCQQLRLPTPDLYAVFGAQGGYSATGEVLCGCDAWSAFLQSTLPAESVLKPAFGFYGLGVRVLSRDGEIFTQHDGRTLSVQQLYHELNTAQPFRKFVFQRRLIAHHALQQLSGSKTLQTARVVTFVRDGQVLIDHAFLRIAVGGNVVDNLHHGTTGNVMARIDCNSGRLAEGWAFNRDGIMVRIQRHPETQIALTGYQLPDWPEVLALVRRAAILFLPSLCLGWDVGFTPEGPVLVETNMWWDPSNLRAVDLSSGLVDWPAESLFSALNRQARRGNTDAMS